MRGRLNSGVAVRLTSQSARGFEFWPGRPGKRVNTIAAQYVSGVGKRWQSHTTGVLAAVQPPRPSAARTHHRAERPRGERTGNGCAAAESACSGVSGSVGRPSCSR